MHPAVQDITLLLAMSRQLFEAQELEAKPLQAWRAKRDAIFTHLESCGLALSGDDASAATALVREVLEVDDKICARVLEVQSCLGDQIAAARKLRQVLSQGVFHSPHLLQRLA